MRDIALHIPGFSSSLRHATLLKTLPEIREVSVYILLLPPLKEVH